MIIPKPTLHNPDGRYISGLVALCGHESTIHTARAIGVSPRMMRYHMIHRTNSVEGRPISYGDQFALECLAIQACDHELLLTALMDLQRACMYRTNLLRIEPAEVAHADRARKVLELRLMAVLQSAAMDAQS